MKQTIIAAMLVTIGLSSSTFAAGVCSTGRYDTCVSCCNTNASITNRSTCSAQCEAYKAPALKGGTFKKEPGPGQISAGARVLVDDGSCPAGQIKQVTGGSTYGGGSSERTRKCIKR